MARNTQSDLITVATFGDSLEASLARGALEAAGITAVVPGEALGAFSRSRGGLPLTELQVRVGDRDRAIKELRRRGHQ
jgi:hypothetical protein